MSGKQSIRNEMRTRRKALAPGERARASSAVCSRIASDGAVLAALGPPGGGALAVYLASPDEIDLTELVAWAFRSGVAVVAPRWNGTAYELARLRSLKPEDLRAGPMRIPEPAADEIVAPEDVAVWVVPGLAFTRSGKRLGYGGGWYDRLMAAADRRSLRIGVAHAFQVVDDLPTESHDVLLTDVIVPSGAAGRRFRD